MNNKIKWLLKKNAAKSRKVVILWHFYFSVSKENLFSHISIKIT